MIHDHGTFAAVKTIAIAKFKETCLRVLEDVRAGERILVTKRGRPIAQILPPPPASLGAWRGAMKGTGRVVGDLVAPATEAEEWSATRS